MTTAIHDHPGARLDPTRCRACKVELDDNATATIYEESDGEGFKYQVAFINSEGHSEESEMIHGCESEEIAISEACELYRDLTTTV